MNGLDVGILNILFDKEFVLTVIAACYLPRRLWALPVLEQFASAFSYAPFLRMADGGSTLVGFTWLAAAMLTALVLVTWTTIQEFRQPVAPG